jgi:alpha amylase-like protein
MSPAVSAPVEARTWSKYPSIYEINTWVWLSELRAKTGTPVHLGTVPPQEWDRVAELGVDAVWLLGVWERSPAGISIANRNVALQAEFRHTLDDFAPADNVGSPFCVRRYVVDEHFGGPAGLAAARCELRKRGLRLLLDFVPNHVAPDHPWVCQHPEYFIQGTMADARTQPASYIRRHGVVYACGRDPYFPAWPDVLQLNAFNAGVRGEARATLTDIAGECDGVRCDMAMLLTNSVFGRTWGRRAGPPPPTEYWREVIPTVKQQYPDFLFIAEAYWDLEWELQQQGFDFCYDKRLYDRLAHGDARSVTDHLRADASFQNRLVRFIENHDEPRAASAFSSARERAAAVVSSTLPGARLFHDGQFDGRHTRLPVFLARRPDEPLDCGLHEFYAHLLGAVTSATLRDGDWRLCEHSGWPDNNSHERIGAWCWNGASGRYLVTVNLSEGQAQGRIHVDWPDVIGRDVTLKDTLSNSAYTRSGDELVSTGLYVDLAPWGCHLFEVQKRTES